MTFRYDVGALRALSVIAVFFYHFNIPFFNGGFIGVDIFFVISGYLMTGIIINGLEKNKFSYLQFIIKRFKRIFPALLFLGVFFTIVSCFLFFDKIVSNNTQQILYGFGFISNFFYWLHQHYFEPSANEKIFLHTWSLSVEWQFYLVYPCLLLLLKRIYLKNKKYFNLIILCFTLISLILCIYSSYHYSHVNFYMLPGRAREMYLGGLACLYVQKIHSLLYSKKGLINFLLYSILVVCIIFFDHKLVWPSAYTIIPTVAVFFILCLNIETKFLRNPTIQFFGNISYSLYLWHWPIFVVSNYFLITETKYFWMPMLLSFLFAIISYYFIEKNKTFDNMKILTSISLTGFVLVLFVNNLSVSKSDVLKDFRFWDENQKVYFEYDNTFQNNPCNCALTPGVNSILDKERCLKIDTSKSNIMLIGDSHSAQYSKSLREKLPTNINLLEVSASYTFPFLKPRGDEISVNGINELFDKFIPKNAENIDLIYISLHLMMKDRMEMNYSDDEIKSNLKELIAYLNRYNINYYFIGQSESYSVRFPKILLGKGLFDDIEIDSFIQPESYEMNLLMKEIIPKDRYIDIYNHKSITKVDRNTNDIYMYDNNHLTEFGANQILDKIIIKDYLASKIK